MDDRRPFNVLNVYIEPDFRKKILTEIVDRKNEIDPDARRKLFQLINEKVRVNGFKNPLSAPRNLLVKSLEPKFEKDSRFTQTLLQAWYSLRAEFGKALTRLLPELGFVNLAAEIFDSDADNSFNFGWPDGLGFDTLPEKINALEPGLVNDKDEAALMAVLITGRLP